MGPTPGANVNMVSGVNWPGGDPFLQRQNEPSLAVSTRNPLHLLAGANDYRTVDLAGIPQQDEANKDAWLGLFQSYDGGKTWTSWLFPGYPQDPTAVGVSSPAFGFNVGSDPVVRAGTNGLFYYAGIVFNRQPAPGASGPFGLGRVIVGRFIDSNNTEAIQSSSPPDPSAGPNANLTTFLFGNSIQYLGMTAVDNGTAQVFLDKPWLAVDIPRSGASTCTVGGGEVPSQSFPGGNVYVAYTAFTGDEDHGRILFTRSQDCGQTWSPPVQLDDSSANNPESNQGAQIAIDPGTGTVYVVWRRFANFGLGDALVVVQSTNGGQSFTAPVTLISSPTFQPFDLAGSPVQFRLNSFPTMTADGSGRVYVAWSQGGAGAGGDARIVVSTSTDGQNWSTPTLVDSSSTTSISLGRGDQIMPAMTFAGGQLAVVYYDFRDDSTLGTYTPFFLSGVNTGLYTEFRNLLGDLLSTPPPANSAVFGPAPSDALPQLRHSMEVWIAEAPPGLAPLFTPAKVSQYDVGSTSSPTTVDGLAVDSTTIVQLQVNAPNLPLFSQGTLPFIGDYLDIAAVPFVHDSNGNWIYNVAPANDTVFYPAWTDNRDVHPPADGNWAHYTPVVSGSLQPISLFDGTTPTQGCQVGQTEGQTGMRNQNIYTSPVTLGMVAASPGNNKPLNTRFPRAFVVEVQNTSLAAETFRLSILNQPPGGSATFTQNTSTITTSGLFHVDVTVPARSTIARSVFVESSNAQAQIRVLVQQITGPGGTVIPNGLQSTVALNADSSAPANPNITNSEIYDPNITNPNITNPNITNPNITNPNITNPNITNPNITNVNVESPNITNPNITNPNITNPNITNPNITNPNITNPNITNSDLISGAVSDVSWTISNNGTSTMAYTVKNLLTGPIPQGFQTQIPPNFVTQLMIHQIYITPDAAGCNLGGNEHMKLLANIINPVFEQATNNDAANPNITNSAPNDATISLGPNETAQVTLRFVNPDRTTNTGFNPLVTVITTVTSHGADTTSLQQGNPQPPVAASQLIILTAAVPGGTVGASYAATLRSAGGTGAKTWTITVGSLPPGLSLNPGTGLISGVPTAGGIFNFTATVTDGSGAFVSEALHITVVTPAPLAITTAATLPVGTVGVAYQNLGLGATGGVGARTWSLMNGVLPSGINLSGSVLSGTPTEMGTFSFTVQVTDSSLPTPQVASRTFTLAVGAPVGAHLVFVAEPPASVSVDQQLTVQVQAQTNVGGPLNGATITMTLGANPGSATLAGTTELATNGIASFSDLSLNRTGNGYTLVATAPGLAPVTSTPFNVTAPSPTGASFGDLVVADGSAALTNGTLIRVASDGSSANLITSTSGCPTGIAFDSTGNQFLADPCTDSILEVGLSGSVSVFFTGAPLQNPVSVAVDLSDNVIVGDDAANAVFRISPAGTTISQVATLTATPSILGDIALAVDNSGNVIVANDNVTSQGVDSEILTITPGGTVTTIFTGTAITSTNGLVVLPSGNYVVASSLQSSLMQVTPQGAVSTLVQSGSLCCGMSGLALDNGGNFYTILTESGQIVRVSSAGTVSPVFSGAPLSSPNALAVFPQEWAQMNVPGPAPAPRGLLGFGSGFNPATDRMTVFGGGTINGDLNDLWTLTNANGFGTPGWIQQNAPNGPGVRSGHSSVYDAATNRLIVFGGFNGVSALNDVWVLTNADGTATPSWIHLAPSGTPPPARYLHSAVYDSHQNVMTVFGGVGFNDVWILTNANGLGGAPAWTPLTPTGTPPPAMGGHSAVYDPNSGNMIVFGGGPSSGPAVSTNAVWILIGANGAGSSAWVNTIQNGAINSPPPRWGHVATYDASRDEMTIFGGSSGNPSLSNSPTLQDTWVLDGASGANGIPTWRPLTGGQILSPLPSGRKSMVAAGDSANRRITIFAGDNGQGTLNNDVWTFAFPTGDLQLPAQSCSLESSLRSLESLALATVQFINHTNQSLNVYWLDYSGQRVFYRSLAPSGDAYIQSTYLTHPWVITDSANNCLKIYMPIANPGRATITP